jgi:hypothetical protein
VELSPNTHPMLVEPFFAPNAAQLKQRWHGARLPHVNGKESLNSLISIDQDALPLTT